jgi:hypothetical protein
VPRNAIVFHGTGANPEVCRRFLSTSTRPCPRPSWSPGTPPRPNTGNEPVLQADYDWAAIKAHARDLYFINSRHDPMASTTGRDAPRSSGWAALRSFVIDEPPG